MQGRYSFVGAQPSMEVVAQGRSVEVTDHWRRQNGAISNQELDDPMQVLASLRFLCLTGSGLTSALGRLHRAGRRSQSRVWCAFDGEPGKRWNTYMSGMFTACTARNARHLFSCHEHLLTWARAL